jgi:hypothetical protein
MRALRAAGPTNSEFQPPAPCLSDEDHNNDRRHPIELSKAGKLSSLENSFLKGTGLIWINGSVALRFWSRSRSSNEDQD